MVLASEHASLERLVNRVNAFMKEGAWDADLVYRVTLLLSEAVANAIEHGNRFDEEKQVTVELIAHPACIEVCVEDQGPGFDPGDVPNPLAEERLLSEGGRGLFLIQHMADDVAFERGGCRIRFWVHRGA